MKLDQAFPSNYLKQDDLQGRAHRLTIDSAVMEDLGDDRKLVLYFKGAQKGMVCNKTNAMTIAEAYGTETDNWIGALVEVYFDPNIFYAGKRTGGLRVRIPVQANAAIIQPATQGHARMQHSDERSPPPLDDDEVPF